MKEQTSNAHRNKLTSKFRLPYEVYSLAFSYRPQQFYRLAIGSIILGEENQIRILMENQEGELYSNFLINHYYPPSKIQFIPDQTGNNQDLLATSEENLNIWKIGSNQATLELALKCDDQFNFPLTSMDWHPSQFNLIATSSIDATCTVWDIEKGMPYFKLIPNQGLVVNDIGFSMERNVFATVGDDCMVRQFDVRDLNSSLIQHKGLSSVLKLAWNRSRNNSTLIAFIEQEMNYVTVIDIRRPIIPIMRLENHRNSVNALCWAPNSPDHLCTVGEDKNIFIWDLSIKSEKEQRNRPLLCYRCQSQIANIAWCPILQQKIAICYENVVQVLQ